MYGITEDVTDKVDLRDAEILGGFGGKHRNTDQYIQVNYLRVIGSDLVYRVETVETLRETNHRTYRIGPTAAARKNWKACAANLDAFYILKTLNH